MKLFWSRRSRIPYSYVATCRISTKEREHASQSKRRRPQYGNHSTNLPFGNDEHTFYIRLYKANSVYSTVHEEVVKKTTSAPWEKEHMQSLHLFFMLNLLIQQLNYIPLSFSLPIASHVLCLLCSKMRCGMTLPRKQKWAQKCGMMGAA